MNLLHERVERLNKISEHYTQKKTLEEEIMLTAGMHVFDSLTVVITLQPSVR